MTAIEGVVLGLAVPWILLAVTLLATIDGFFPPVPSESIVIAVAVLTITGDGHQPVAARPRPPPTRPSAGTSSRTRSAQVPIDRLRIFSARRGQATLRLGHARALARRGTVDILSPGSSRSDGSPST